MVILLMFFFLDLFTKLLKRGPLKSFFFNIKNVRLFYQISRMTSSLVPTVPISRTISLRTASKQMSEEELKRPPHFTGKTKKNFHFYYEQNYSFHWKKQTIVFFFIMNKTFHFTGKTKQFFHFYYEQNN